MQSRFSCNADEFYGIGVNIKQPFGQQITEQIISMYVCVKVRTGHMHEDYGMNER